MENGRHRVFNFAESSFDVSVLNDKLDYVSKELKCAAKVNLAFGFVLKNIEDGICRHFYAHENNTIVERSKVVCTLDDIANLKEKKQKMDIIDLCTRGRANTKWKFYKLTNLTVFAAVLKDIPVGCKDTVLPEPFLRNCNVNCLAFETLKWHPLPFQSTCSAFIWQREIGGGNMQNLQPFPEQFWGRRSIKNPGCSHDWYSESGGDLFHYDIDFVDGELIGELARRSIQKYEKSVKLVRYNNHISYVNNINALFKAFRWTTCDTFFSKTGNLERHLVTCSHSVKHIYPKNFYELRESPFEKMDAFNIPYKKGWKLFKNTTIFDFESV